MVRESKKRLAATGQDTVDTLNSERHHKAQKQGGCTGEKRQHDDQGTDSSAQKARLDRRTQQKRPQEGTVGDSQERRQRTDRRTQQKRRGEDTDKDDERTRHRSDRQSQQKRALSDQDSDSEDQATARKKTTSTGAAIGSSIQEPD